jgi:hypothetical protein
MSKRQSKTATKKGKGKTPAKRTSRTTDDELASVVEAHQKSEAGKAGGKSKPASRAQQLTNLFLKTPEMQECEVTAGSITNKLDPEDTVTVKIEVPKEFIRLTEFLEQKHVGAGAKPRPAPKVLNQILLNELHDQLHRLIVGPLGFEYYRNLWNRFCDAQGAPEEKIDDGQSTAKQGGKEGPF